jgi:hypothetical protein
MDAAARTPRSTAALLRRVFAVLLAGAALADGAALALVSPDGRPAVALAVAGGILALGGVFLAVDRRLAGPLDRLARERDHPALELRDTPPGSAGW